MLDLTSAIGRADMAFVQLLHSVRTGQAAFPVQFGGRSFWDDLAADPARTASFDAQMGVDVSQDAPLVVDAYDWGSLGSVTDVGGGNGSLLTAMLKAYPTLRGTVVDLPGTARAAHVRLAREGLSDRGDAIAGSFFEPLPPGAGGYVLSAILHDWDDASARLILRRCAEAAGRDGAVFVVEKFAEDGRSVRTAMDLRMLVYFAGKERTPAQLGALAADVGLTVAAVHRAGLLAVVEMRPSGAA